MSQQQPLETHPFEPYIPDGARILIMGTFPPPSRRWAMNFYYPNPTNDFWKVMGLVFYDNPLRFWIPEERRFREDDIRRLLDDRGIALSDTGATVRRLQGNASDKDLEIVTPVQLDNLLEMMPQIRAIATTGEKAAAVLARLTGTEAPRVGQCVSWHRPEYPDHKIAIYRMPSTSRAYPLALEKKAAFYATMFRNENLL